MNITTIPNEARRGCGYRKQGGMYLMAGKPSQPCGKLPHELSVCPTCGAGIKASRGWTWIDPRPLFEKKACDLYEVNGVCQCILDPHHLPEQMGLVWIGEKFYPTPQDFLDEGMARGISRRISAIPKEFVLGHTWVLFAHRKGLAAWCSHPKLPTTHTPLTQDEIADCPDCKGTCWVGKPAIFGCFKPERIEYIVKNTDPVDKLERLEKRGLTLIRLEWDKDENGNGKMFPEQEPISPKPAIDQVW